MAQSVRKMLLLEARSVQKTRTFGRTPLAMHGQARTVKHAKVVTCCSNTDAVLPDKCTKLGLINHDCSGVATSGACACASAIVRQLLRVPHGHFSRSTACLASRTKHTVTQNICAIAAIICYMKCATKPRVNC